MVLISSITTAFTTALITLFRILFSLSALLVVSFYIVSFISFTNIIYYILLIAIKNRLCTCM